jgi:hypothetical protein
MKGLAQAYMSDDSAHRKGFIKANELEKLVNEYGKSAYGIYIRSLIGSRF